jgi:hypothetical protein
LRAITSRANLFNFFDRAIPPIVAEPIRKVATGQYTQSDLRIDDLLDAAK